MKQDYTQQQSVAALRRSEQLSLQALVPPAEIPGYKVQRLLGQGAFGQVWLGSDLNTGRQVAIKFYLRGGAVNWSLLGQEVKHLVSMSTGRYIVQVLAVGWDADPPYYVMEYLENGSLEDQIRARGVLEISEAVSMFREIADGLSYAHAKGVLHCDLKPANVLLDHAMRPRLADFGQSRMSDDQTPSLGTLFFMAPEQADLQATPDSAWDVYALGSIAYTMLVGSPPYRTPQALEQLDTAHSLPERLKRYQNMMRHVQRPRLHYRRRGIDKTLCQIVDRCLAVQPEQRFGNAQQVLAAIDSRNHARARRPLYAMGILGPILLLMIMFAFSARSISIAKRESLNRVQTLYLRGNLQTAKYAKATMEGEIRSLYRLVEQEASRGELQQLLTSAVEASEELLQQLAAAEIDDAHTAIHHLPQQRQLEQYLQERMRKLIVRDGKGDGVAIFNSLFVNEVRGTNMALTFADPREEELAESPVGKNFAYRSYFTGHREDGDPMRRPDTYRPLRETHLSASFRSTSTGKWKLGISAPIWPRSEEGSTEEREAPSAAVQPLGVFVLTVNLGDFVLLSSVADGEDQFTTLVDGRSGNQKGTLLQHPLIENIGQETMLRSRMPQMDPRQLERLLTSDGIVDYIDPAGEFPAGAAFQGTWIAALAQVHLPVKLNVQESSEGGSALKSDLWVLVQERSKTVTEPMTELGNRLQRESYKVLVGMLTLMLVLWGVVFRMGQVMRPRLLQGLGWAILSDAKYSGSSIESSRHSALQATIDSDR